MPTNRPRSGTCAGLAYDDQGLGEPVGWDAVVCCVEKEVTSVCQFPREWARVKAAVEHVAPEVRIQVE